jgi:hypothetical protein
MTVVHLQSLPQLGLSLLRVLNGLRSQQHLTGLQQEAQRMLRACCDSVHRQAPLLSW